jgi:hypothetical protein
MATFILPSDTLYDLSALISGSKRRDEKAEQFHTVKYGESPFVFLNVISFSHLHF